MKSEKRGLLAYSMSTNIGDEIQSIAAKQFMSEVDEYIDRDAVDDFKSEQKTKVILNGWFKYKPEKWPPSKDIEPLFISFHIDKGFFDGSNTEEAIKYFKNHEPIGCRDMTTLRLLRYRGILSYFSGCLTLTLDYKNSQTGTKVYLIDVPSEIRNLLPDEYKNNIVEITHEHSYITNEERFTHAHKILNQYQDAKLVLTSKIHCALPCIAMGTPVIFLHENLRDIRFPGLIELFDHYKTSEILAGRQKIIFPVRSNEEKATILAHREKNLCFKFAQPGREFVSICTSIDNNMFKVLPTLLTSINLNTRHNVKVYILHRNLNEEQLNLLRRINMPGMTIHPIRMDGYLQDIPVQLLRHTTISTMDRIFIPSVLKNEQKIIYLDADIVVNNDISILNNFETSQKGIAARESINVKYKSIKDTLGIWMQNLSRDAIKDIKKDVNLNFTGFNAGVLIMDLDKLRDNKMQDECLRYMCKYGVNDQLALNLYSNGDFEKIPQSWNVFANQEKDEDVPEKNIIHWAGENKPWNNPKCSMAKYWLTYETTDKLSQKDLLKIKLVQIKRRLRKSLSKFISKYRNGI